MVEEEIQEEVVADSKKQKKIVRRRKSKKEKENVLTSAVRLAVESGKVEYGLKSVTTNVKVLVVANNLPENMKAKITEFTKSVPVISFDGSSMDLGSVCGCPFPVSVLSISDVGSSNILEMIKK